MSGKKIIFFFIWCAVLVGMPIVVGVHLYAKAAQHIPLVQTETITSFEIMIEGQSVRCERREDHVFGLTETAC